MKIFANIYYKDVAMIIIITMICKVYFPEALERSISEENGMPATRTSVFRRISDDEETAKEHHYYSSDEEGEDANKQEKGSLMKEYRDDPNDASPRKGDSALNDVMAFEQQNTSKGEVLRRLAFCVIMLNVAFVTWGVLQERMLTRRYPRFTGEFFTYSYALVFTTRFWTMIMSGFLMVYLKPRRSSSTIIYEYSFPSISNMLSSWCQYEALRYVSFPAVTLFKSFKLAPVMAMGKFLGNKQCKYLPHFSFILLILQGYPLTLALPQTPSTKIKTRSSV